MILTIPVRRTEFRRSSGERVQVLEVVPGFCRVTADDEANNNAFHGEHILISNPLIEGMLSFLNAGRGEGGSAGSSGLATNERVFIVLDEPPSSNPGDDDNGPSLNDNLAAV
jgi:hypothetical protein